MSNNRRSTSAVPERKYTASGSRTPDTTLSYGNADAHLVRDAVATVTDAGDAVLFGRTSDGGALVVHFLSGGHVEKVYLTTVEEVDSALQNVLELHPGT